VLKPWSPDGGNILGGAKRIRRWGLADRSKSPETCDWRLDLALTLFLLVLSISWLP
jgi:hypothetical protein